MLDSFFNSIFGSVIDASPLGGLALVCFVLTLIVTIIYKLFTDQRRLKAIKDETNEIKKRMKDYKDDPQKVMQLQKEMMSKSMESMKHSLKPMIITFLPLIIIFGWLRGVYGDDGYTVRLWFISSWL